MNEAEYITPTTWEQCARHVEAGGIVAVLVSAVLVAQVVAVVTRGPLGKEGDSDER